MIRAFGLGDILTLKRLVPRGTYLDMERALLSSSPLVRALMGYFSLGRPKVFTLVLDALHEGHRLRGFIQGEECSGSACELVCVCPSLDGTRALEIWQDLLQSLCERQGGRGVQRLLAKVGEADAEAKEALRQAGFGAYARRQILSCEHPSFSCQGELALRPVLGKDAPGLERLYANITPRLVQQAEGFGRRCHLKQLLFGPREKGYVSERGGEIRAYLCLKSHGGIGWARALVHPDLDGDELLASCLKLLLPRKFKTLYWEVREYEGGLVGALLEQGFEPFLEELLMVKYIAVHAGMPAKKVIALEKKVEGVTTIVHGR
jgi:hypothetical protein